MSIFRFFLVRIFPHLEWIRRDREYLSGFSPNVEKYGQRNSAYEHFSRYVSWLLKLSRTIRNTVDSGMKWIVYGDPQVSRQKKKAPGKRKMPAAKNKLVTAKEKSSRQKKNARGKNKLVTAKEKSSRQKKNARGKKEIGHAYCFG